MSLALKKKVTEKARLLLVSLPGGDELVGSLNRLLETAQTSDFEVIAEPLSVLQPTGDGVLLPRLIGLHHPNIVLLCFPKAAQQAACAVCEALDQGRWSTSIVIVTDSDKPADWYDLVKLGVDDFLTPPFKEIDVLPRLWRLRRQPAKDDCAALQLKERVGLMQLVGESPSFLAEIQKIPTIARCDATVIIAGETGTGKEMFARAIHHLSPRAAKPFVPLNCGAIPVDLVENELFGHKPGAFTSANTSSIGLLRQADGGSLFLDEVNCLPLLAQVKLLRFLQDKELRPLGAHKSCRADVRVIGASNANLDEAMRNGCFRQDLYYRLNVIRLALPPLRERKEDIPLLAQHFLAKYAPAYDATATGLSASALRKLILYDWPGNVRELQNVIERGLVLCPQTLLRAVDIELPCAVSVEPGESFQTLKAKVIARFERAYLLDLLHTHNGNITRAAQAAGKHRRAFWEMMRKYHIVIQPRSNESSSLRCHSQASK